MELIIHSAYWQHLVDCSCHLNLLKHNNTKKAIQSIAFSKMDIIGHYQCKNRMVILILWQDYSDNNHIHVNQSFECYIIDYYCMEYIKQSQQDFKKNDSKTFSIFVFLE